MEARKDRLVQLDVIRVAATLLIVLFHFDVHISNDFQLSNMLLSDRIPFGRSIGDIGVQLFFFISGATLWYNYSGRLNVKKFYQKRASNIYPFYYVAWFCFFVIYFLKNHQTNPNIPTYRILYTLLGLDGYFCANGPLFSVFEVAPNFYWVGEWFLGAILLCYLIYPLLHMSFEKKPILTTIVMVAAQVLLLLLPNRPTSFYRRIFDVFLGMLFVRYAMTKRWLFPIALGALIALQFLEGPIRALTTDSVLIARPVSVALFIALWFASQSRLCTRWGLSGWGGLRTLSRYSFTAILTHHQIIFLLISLFTLGEMTRRDIFILLGIVLLFTFISAQLIWHLTHFLLGKLKPSAKTE